MSEEKVGQLAIQVENVGKEPVPDVEIITSHINGQTTDKAMELI